jgi:endonuclease/exonuclease/phosphatase family metal-dependent hydrolase
MKGLFRVILLIINLLFAGALIVSTLAGVIEPSRMVIVSILSYGYVVFLLANVVFIIIWLCLARWEFLISVAAIVARLSFIPLFFQIGGTLEAATNDNTLRLMTFNVHSFKGQDNDTLLTADSGAVLFLKMVDEEQPDVICLQEYSAIRKLKVKVSLLERGYAHSFGAHGPEKPSQCTLFSRYPIVKGEEIDGKSKFYVDVDKDGKMVRICCVHLDSYQLNSDDYESLERLSHVQTDSSTHKLLHKFTETAQQHEQEWNEELLPLIESTKIPFVIAGDFNDTPASYIYQQASKLLSDTFVEQGRGFGTTYHGLFPAFRIDYILHSNDLEALSYKRISTPISDHFPIVATMLIH